MESTTPTPEGPARRAWGVALAWIGGITAVLGFIGTITGTFTTISEHLHHNGRLDAQINLARSQLKQGENSQALGTYSAVLKQDPNYSPALEAQLLTAEHWVEDFEARAQPGESEAVAAGKKLDLIFPVLDAALTRAKGTQSADIQAHLGWAHWANTSVALREPPDVAENDIQAALAADPTNVYANAMLGFWQVRNNRDFKEGMQHFETSLATGRERAWVRRFEVRALLFQDEPEPQMTIVNVANAMRVGNEPMDDEQKQNIITYCCSPSDTFHKPLVQDLSVLPRAEFWQTFLWLDSAKLSDADTQEFRRRAIVASLDEIAGQRAKALAEWKTLLNDVKGSGTRYDEVASEGITRLSK